MARARSRSRRRQVSFKIDRGSDRVDVYDRVEVYSSPSKPPSMREVARNEHKSTTRALLNGKGKAKMSDNDSDSESMESPSSCGSERDDDRKSFLRGQTPKPPSSREEHKSTTRRPSHPPKGKGKVREEASDRESRLERPSNCGSERDDDWESYSRSRTPRPPSRREEHKSTTRLSKGKGNVRAEASDRESRLERPSNCGSEIVDDRKTYSRGRTPFKPPSKHEEHQSNMRPSTKGKGKVRGETSDRESNLESALDRRRGRTPKLPPRREEHQSNTRSSKGKGEVRASDRESSLEGPLDCRTGRTPKPPPRREEHQSNTRPSKGKGRARVEASDRKSSLESPPNCGRGRTPKPPSRREVAVVIKEHKSITRPSSSKGKGKARAETSGGESGLESPLNRATRSEKDDRRFYLRGQTPGPQIGLQKSIIKNRGHRG